MRTDPGLVPACVREIIDGVVEAVRTEGTPRVRALLDDLAQVADPAALLLLRSRCDDDLSSHGVPGDCRGNARVSAPCRGGVMVSEGRLRACVRGR